MTQTLPVYWKVMLKLAVSLFLGCQMSDRQVSNSETSLHHFIEIVFPGVDPLLGNATRRSHRSAIECSSFIASKWGVDDGQVWCFKHCECPLLQWHQLSGQDFATIFSTQRWHLMDRQAEAEGSLTTPVILLCVRMSLQVGTRWGTGGGHRPWRALTSCCACGPFVVSFHSLALVASNCYLLSLACREEPSWRSWNLTCMGLGKPAHNIQETQFLQCLCLSEFFT